MQLKSITIDLCYVVTAFVSASINLLSVNQSKFVTRGADRVRTHGSTGIKN